MCSVERELAKRARPQPSRIGIEEVEQVLPEAARKIVFDTIHITKPPPMPVLPSRSTYACDGETLLEKCETLSFEHP